ncbi:hypothetical protein [uncultured Draconibacterium sp.]|uniref:hypothetical protein n=1 Tax=uncultured Draconibacterium sp. TaxID=1573823 RepID=UPI0032165261
MVCSSIYLEEGWNIFSINNQPSTTDLFEIFYPFLENGSLIKIQDESGVSFEDLGIYGGWWNGIGDVRNTEGYKIKVTQNDSFEVCGNFVEYPFAIPLTTGWNIIGYPQSSNFDAEEVLSNLIDAGTFIKAQDESGNSIEDWGIYGGVTNFIGDFKPGEGYKIKMDAPDTLWISEAYSKSGHLTFMDVKTKFFIPVYRGNGTDQMNFNLTGSLISELKPGDEIGVFDGGVCVGAVSIQEYHLENKSVQVIASAKDEKMINGFEQGDAYSLRIWDPIKEKEMLLITSLVEGPIKFSKNESVFLSLENLSFLDVQDDNKKRVEANCYPNPFSDFCEIYINLDRICMVEIDVVNLLNQPVQRVLNSTMLSTGFYNFKWNGENSDGNKLSSGVYIIRLKFDNRWVNRKVILNAGN